MYQHSLNLYFIIQIHVFFFVYQYVKNTFAQLNNWVTMQLTPG